MSQRILLIAPHLETTGAAWSMRPVVSRLARDGHDVQLASLTSAGPLPREWQPPELSWEPLLVGKDARPGRRDLPALAWNLRRLVDQLRPDHLHVWGLETLRPALLATQPCPGLETLECPITLTLEQLIPEVGFLGNWLDSRMASRVHRLVVPHAAVADSWIEHGFPETAATVIPHGLDPDEVGATSDNAEPRKQIRAQLGIPQDTWLAVAIADLEPRMRLKDLVWATDLLTCIRDDFHLAIVGSGSQLSRLQRFADQTEAGDHVHFLPPTVSPIALLRAADAYWHAHFQQPNPLPLMMAMGLGVPCVSVYGAGTDELIRHQETGFAVNFGARDEFARWTKYLLERPESGQQLARQGQAFVQAAFDATAYTDAYSGLYA